MKIDVLETSLRDGVQAEGISLSLEDKLALIRLFDGLGLQFIEAGNPAAIPKDKLFLCGGELPETKNSKLVAFGSTRHKNNLSSEDLSLKTLALSKTQYISLVGKSSLTHIERVLGVTPDDNLIMIYDSIRYLCDRDKTVFFDAEHFFDGFKEDAAYAMETLRTAKNAGAELLVLCDTNGASTPEEISAITGKAARAFKKTRIGIHCHDDSGLAVANTMAAVAAGASHIQGTFLGFGERCGNCNLSTVIPNLQLKSGYEILSADALKKFTSSARRVAEIANISLRKNIPYVGKCAFTHKAGMHSDGVLKYPPAFEHINPEDIGNDRNFLLSEAAGRAIFQKKAEAAIPDIVFSPADISSLLDNLKRMEMLGYQFEGADASFYIFLLKSLGKYKPFFELINFSVTSTRPSDGENSAEAVIEIKVGDSTEKAVARGNGPVNALDIALRLALSKFYPVINNITLTDYKVRVIDSEAATKAKVRVLITSSDGNESWTTVGVSTDVVEASRNALCDAVEYLLAVRKEK